jgi:hypothetical protein
VLEEIATNGARAIGAGNDSNCGGTNNGGFALGSCCGVDIRGGVSDSRMRGSLGDEDGLVAGVCGNEAYLSGGLVTGHSAVSIRPLLRDDSLPHGGPNTTYGIRVGPTEIAFSRVAPPLATGSKRHTKDLRGGRPRLDAYDQHDDKGGSLDPSILGGTTDDGDRDTGGSFGVGGRRGRPW